MIIQWYENVGISREFWNLALAENERRQRDNQDDVTWRRKFAALEEDWHDRDGIDDREVTPGDVEREFETWLHS